MSWWESKRKPLHHQFLVLTVARRQASGNDCVAAMYDICIERVGKADSYFRASAEQKITIAPAQLEEPCRKNNKVLFGLFDALPPLRRDIKGRLPDQCVSASAFVDVLDMKWRAPRNALAHWSLCRCHRRVSVTVSLGKYKLLLLRSYAFPRRRLLTLLVPPYCIGRRKRP